MSAETLTQRVREKLTFPDNTVDTHVKTPALLPSPCFQEATPARVR